MEYGDTYHNEPTWVVTLNKYQRDNLLFLLNLCGYPPGNEYAVEPFTIMVNGDWIGEIACMLSKHLRQGQECDSCLIGADDRPNTTIKEVRRRIAEFIVTRGVGIK